MANTLKFGNGEWYGKKDTILAYNDENSNYKPLPFDFSRDSSATVINKDGLIETVGSGQPRIDYKDDSKGALLLEPESTNLITYSEDFSGWFSTNYTAQSNVSNSPSGNNDASSLTNPNGAGGLIKQNVVVAESTNYTFSFYAKKGTASDVKYSVYDNTNGSDIIPSTSYYSQLNSDTFTRVTVSFATPIGCTSIGAYVLRDSAAAGTVIVWGAQVEALPYATSYIPTQGSAVTRLADVCNNSNVSVLDLGNSYTLFLDIPYLTDTSNKVFCDIKLSNNVESFTIRNFVTSLRVYNNLDTSYPTSQISSSTKKWVIRIDGTSFKLFGAESSLSGSLSTERSIGKVNFKGNQIPIELKDFKIYNTALSDAECEALTQV